MSQVCPVDGKGCCDDLCYGGGCLRMEGYPMLVVCDFCHGLIDEEMPELSTCACDGASDD
jgi:hypothetical protein